MGRLSLCSGKDALSLLLPAETMSSSRRDVLMPEFACFAGKAGHTRAMYFVLAITHDPAASVART